MSGDSNRAVFLSYASQDATVARRICEALRSAGVEVWFDQSELRGGDLWDLKIRRQIKDCALFLPVISANTQIRLEGYYRLEWKLAVDRSHLMSEDMTFLVPVVIDDTNDATAKVPDKFREVQWTRLPGGETPSAFTGRVNALLAGEGTSLSEPATAPAAGGGRRAALPERRQPARHWLATAAIAVTALAGFFVWRPWRALATPNPLDTTVALAPKSDEVSELLSQARELIYEPDVARNEFALAESLLRRATDIAPNSSKVWGMSALVNSFFISRGYDRSQPRFIRAQADADKALRLDPKNIDALLALGSQRQMAGEIDRARELLERARAADPENPKVYIALSRLLTSTPERVDLQLEAAQHVAKNEELLYNVANNLRGLRRWAEAAALCDRVIASAPFWRAFQTRAVIEFHVSGDPVKISQWLDRVQETKRDEPRVVYLRYLAAMLKHDGTAAEQALRAFVPDFFEDSGFRGPKAFLLAQALALSGRRDGAMEQWRQAEEALRGMLKPSPTVGLWRAQLAVVLAAQERTTEAREIADALRETTSLTVLANLAQAFALLGDQASAIDVLRRCVRREGLIMVGAATLRTDPRWASLQTHPDFPDLLQAFAAADGLAVTGSNP